MGSPSARTGRPRLRRNRFDREAVGHGRGAGNTHPSGAHEHDRSRVVQPGREDPRLRRVRPDAEALGRRHWTGGLYDPPAGGFVHERDVQPGWPHPRVELGRPDRQALGCDAASPGAAHRPRGPGPGRIPPGGVVVPGGDDGPYSRGQDHRGGGAQRALALAESQGQSLAVHEVERLVYALYDKPMLRAEVLASIRDDPAPSEAARREARPGPGRSRRTRPVSTRRAGASCALRAPPGRTMCGRCGWRRPPAGSSPSMAPIRVSWARPATASAGIRTRCRP